MSAGHHSNHPLQVDELRGEAATLGAELHAVEVALAVATRRISEAEVRQEEERCAFDDLAAQLQSLGAEHGTLQASYVPSPPPRYAPSPPPRHPLPSPQCSRAGPVSPGYHPMQASYAALRGAEHAAGEQLQLRDSLVHVLGEEARQQGNTGGVIELVMRGALGEAEVEIRRLGEVTKRPLTSQPSCYAATPPPHTLLHPLAPGGWYAGALCA